ncbi:hypothetical protein BJY52DRAFT_1191760 [Lactarius psammicola]|nr:hypothetical protein BJY52DRAFT_1191760 [Lactarius psammicola]
MTDIRASEITTVSMEDHMALLATNWWSVEKFLQHGVQCREGAFTQTEAEQVEIALRGYQETQRLDDEEMEDLLYGENKLPGFWAQITRAVPGRRVRSVYDHVQRARHPLGKKGSWTEGDDAQMKAYIDKHGIDWTKIGDVMARPQGECRDRYYKYLIYQVRAGHWSSDEEGRLVQIIQDLNLEGKTNKTVKRFWKEVARHMDNTRSAKQCRDKWTDSLSQKLQNGGKALRWGSEDTFILVQKVASLNVDSEDAIDWSSLPDEGWQHWSKHKLQQKWSGLRAMVHTPGMTHHDVVLCLMERHSKRPHSTPVASSYS